MELSRLHNENEYLGETLSDDILPLLNSTLCEECIKCGSLLFLVEYSKTKQNYCHLGKVELTSVNYPEALKNLLLSSHSDPTSFHQNI